MQARVSSLHAPHVDAIAEAKKPETRQRRVERAIEMLLATGRARRPG